MRRAGEWFGRHLEDTKPKNSIAVLDGVRALACLMVVAYHIDLVTFRYTSVWVPNGPEHPLLSSIALAGASGVTLFFVLSGFLLFLPYARAMLGGGEWPAARNFYLRRSFRIIPAYYLCLFVLILVSQRVYLERAHWRELGLFLAFFMDSTYATNHQLNGPFWTLAVEWQYYLLLPLLAWGISLLVKRGSGRWRPWLLVMGLVGVIAWGQFTRYWGMYFATYHNVTFGIPHTVLNTLLFFLYGASGKYLEDFAIGMLISVCYVYTRALPHDHLFNQMMKRLSPWCWRVGILALVFLAMWHFNRVFYNSWPFLNGLVRSGFWLNYYDWLSELSLAIGFGLCVIAILYGTPELQKPFAWAPLRWIGLISYSMYMWHLPLIFLFLNYVGRSIQHWNAALVIGLYWGWALGVIVPFSFLMFVLVEKPWIKLGERFRQWGGKQRIERGSKEEHPGVEAGAEPVLVKK